MMVMNWGGPCAGVVEGDDFILKGGIRHAQKLLKRIRKGEGAFLAGFIHFDFDGDIGAKGHCSVAEGNMPDPLTNHPFCKCFLHFNSPHDSVDFDFDGDSPSRSSISHSMGVSSVPFAVCGYVPKVI